MSRMIFHNADNRVSVGVDVDEDGRVYMALSICHPRDQFTRARANLILNGRLNRRQKNVVMLGKLNPGLMVKGQKLRLGRNLYGPIRDAVRELPESRRNLKDYAYLVAQAVKRSTAKDKAAAPAYDEYGCSVESKFASPLALDEDYPSPFSNSGNLLPRPRRKPAR